MHPFFIPKRSPEEISQSSSAIYRRKKTQIEMVRDRGFSLTKKERIYLVNYQEFAHDFNDNNEILDNIYTRKKDGHKLSVIYNLADTKSKIKQHKDLMQRIEAQYESEEADSFIIVTIPQINTADLMKELKFLVEVFSFDDIAINPTMNVLSQTHILLTPTEKAEFLASNALQQRELPGISIENPIVRSHGAKIGDIFYIKRSPNEELSYYIDELEFWRIVRDIPLIIAAGAKITEEGDDDEGEEDDFGEEGPTADVDE